MGEAGGGGGGGAELEDVVGDGGDHFGECCFFGVGGRDGVFVILVFRVSRRPGFWMSGDDPEWQSAMRIGNSDVDTNLLFENRQCRLVPFVVIYTRDYSTGMHSDVRNAVTSTGSETAEEVAILTINQDHRSNRR